MKRKKIVKGQYGYIRRKKITVTIRTLLMFALSLSLFGIGIWSTGKKENLLTVVAILGCLPACKSAVNMIMFLKGKGCSEQVKHTIEPYRRGLMELYDLIFTSYEKTYQVSHMVIAGHIVCGYTEDAACDTKACEKHVDALLKQGGCKGVTVKIFQDLENYCEGLTNLKKQCDLSGKETEKNVSQGSTDDEQLEEIVGNLLAIAL